MKTNRSSFARRLSNSIIARVTLLLVTALFLTAVFSHIIIGGVSERSVENALQSTVLEIEKNLGRAEVAATNVAWVAHETVDNPEHLFYITRQTVLNNPSVIGSAVALRPDYFEGEHFFAPYSYRDASTGTVVSIQLGNDDYDYFYLDWYQIPSILKKPMWSEPYFDEGGANELIATYSIPLIDSADELVGIVTADISLGWLSDLVKSIKPYENSRTVLISRNGSYLTADGDSEASGETIFSTAMESGSKDIMKISRKMVSGEKGMMRYHIGGTTSFVVFAPLSNGWSAGITCNYKDVLKQSTRMHWCLAFIGLIALTMIFFFCRKIISETAAPILEFSNAAHGIAAGDFNMELPVIETDDEIKELRDSFENMQLSLTNYIAELKSTTATKERMESELNIAREIQKHLLPQNFPKTGLIDMYARVIPAREVGGDLYDFGMKGDEDMLFVVGDVSGKGVPAAIFMSIIGSAFRFTSSLGMTMEEKICKINNSICSGNETGMFVTLFAGKFDIPSREMVYCNCGHNPAVVVEPDGKAHFLPQLPNIAIGVWEGFEYKEQRVVFEKGTRLIFYTDGVTEAEAADKSQYGEERLLAWASSLPAGADAKTLNDSLLDDVRNFTGGNEQNDDITIMVINL